MQGIRRIINIIVVLGYVVAALFLFNDRLPSLIFGGF